MPVLVGLVNTTLTPYRHPITTVTPTIARQYALACTVR